MTCILAGCYYRHLLVITRVTYARTVTWAFHLLLDLTACYVSPFYRSHTTCVHDAYRTHIPHTFRVLFAHDIPYHLKLPSTYSISLFRAVLPDTGEFLYDTVCSVGAGGGCDMPVHHLYTRIAYYFATIHFANYLLIRTNCYCVLLLRARV